MKTFPEVKLLDTRFHKVQVQELVDYLIEAAKNKKKTVVGHVNIRAMNFAYEKSWYRDFLNKADLVFCDGFGVMVGARFNGYSMQSAHRMTAPDYIEDLAFKCEQENLSLFLLAGKPGVVDKAITKLGLIAPNLRVQGHHGYFDKSGKENDLVIEKINKFQPDILYIGFGMPLQERWILDNFNKIETIVFLPLGACLDFYTDSIYRGPRWLTDNGLEWLTRLITEPTRLADRYIVGIPLFFYRVVKKRITQGMITNR
ncbi:WecB/TagA/CpsF family glycosyltransferase [Nostoc sp. DedQUE07]|uniref:WecB/TagA/CpsF family glycosyltransferase n=1 Tax=Nostoc sp. DedQUE07 TaxID=3075392 RepID=UPI002AD48AA4|nr:WecB/TagA/CpsF family glycosyltransferase [Nostoc sp. DedQUE07]MDZ8128618.1 WecB/TagA/CpsF family glycosyltransferase [Nostoc sp. DedQUE07]